MGPSAIWLRAPRNRGAAIVEPSNAAFSKSLDCGQRLTAEYLLDRGADLNWIGYDRHAPFQAAQESGAKDLIEWLRNKGAKLANELE